MLFYPILYSGSLQFATVPDGQNLPASASSVAFSTDQKLKYTAFFADFGPLNLGLTYKFCVELDNMLRKHYQSKCVIYYCSAHPHCRANSAVLICAYLVVNMNSNNMKLCFSFVFKMFFRYLLEIIQQSRHMRHLLVSFSNFCVVCLSF
jgi:hypothetical protein